MHFFKCVPSIWSNRPPGRMSIPEFPYPFNKTGSFCALDHHIVKNWILNAIMKKGKAFEVYRCTKLFLCTAQRIGFTVCLKILKYNERNWTRPCNSRTIKSLIHWAPWPFRFSLFELCWWYTTKLAVWYCRIRIQASLYPDLARFAWKLQTWPPVAVAGF